MSSGPRNDGPLLVSQCQQPCPEQTDKEFRQTTCNWLRFAGRLRESDRAPAPHQQEIDAVCRYSDVERGLSPATIATARRNFSSLLKHTRTRQLIPHEHKTRPRRGPK